MGQSFMFATEQTPLVLSCSGTSLEHVNESLLSAH